MPAGPIFINTAIARREALILIKPPYLPLSYPRCYLDAKWHPSAETGEKEACRGDGVGEWVGNSHCLRFRLPNPVQ